MNDDRFAATPTKPQLMFPYRPWAHLHFDNLDLFTSAFPQDNQLMTMGYIGKNGDTVIGLEWGVLKRVRDRKANFKAEEQIHLLSRLSNGGLFWSKLSPQELKLHYTHRPLSLLPSFLPSSTYLYSSLSTTRHLKNPSFKLGLLSMSSPSRFIDLRLRYNVGEYSQEQYFYIKGNFDYKRWVWGCLLTFDIKRRLLQRNGVKIGCDLGRIGWLGVQLQVDGYRNYKMNYKRIGSYFDLGRISYIYRLHNDDVWTGGLQYEYNLESSESKKTEAVIQYKPRLTQLNKNGLQLIKARVSSSMQIALASSYFISDQIRGCVGVQWAQMAWKPVNFSLALHLGQP